MSIRIVFPRLFVVCFAMSLLAVTAHAQQIETFPHQATQAQPVTTTTNAAGTRSKLENDLTVKSEDQAGEDEPEEPVEGFLPPANFGRVEREMLAAIEERLGTPYRMGATGPNRYDCSGFVWSVFQQAGVSFERATARNLWQEFAPPSENDKYKFGTLVFFNGLHHVGIVADANGFFHASSHGVVYSHFNDYWTKRLSGFRRIPLAQGQSLIASSGR